MKRRRIKNVLYPVLYMSCAFLFLVGMYFAQKYAGDLLFSKNSDLEYVDGEIIEERDRDIPVVNTNITIIRPYLDENVKLVKPFYNYEDEASNQEDAIIYYEGTYMQNSGTDYASGSIFDVVSVLDGTVISVEENDIVGKTVTIRHSNDLISVYQSLDNIIVKKDDKVIQGQIIAKSGKSNINKDLEDHLHFELYYKSAIVNPEEYFDKDINEL